MKIRNKIILICIIVMFLICGRVYAGDALYHFMQAHQDYLAIAKVVNVNGGNVYELEVSELIANASIRKDIPKRILVEIPNGGNVFGLDKGDCIAISLSKRGGGFRIENGAYRITTDNTNTLEVVSSDKQYVNSELAAVELFLKSRGKVTDFYFTGYETYLHKSVGAIEAGDMCIYSPNTGKILPDTFEKNEKFVVEKEKNTTIVPAILLSLLLVFVIIVICCVVYIKHKPKSKFAKFVKKYFDKLKKLKKSTIN